MNNEYMEFVRVSSYSGTSTTGKIELGGGLKFERLKGKDVIIVEDNIETTLSHFVPLLIERAEPLSVEVCTIIAKRLPEPSHCL